MLPADFYIPGRINEMVARLGTSPEDPIFLEEAFVNHDELARKVKLFIDKGEHIELSPFYHVLYPRVIKPFLMYLKHKDDTKKQLAYVYPIPDALIAVAQGEGKELVVSVGRSNADGTKSPQTSNINVIITHEVIDDLAADGKRILRRKATKPLSKDERVYQAELMRVLRPMRIVELARAISETHGLLSFGSDSCHYLDLYSKNGSFAFMTLPPIRHGGYDIGGDRHLEARLSPGQMTNITIGRIEDDVLIEPGTQVCLGLSRVNPVEVVHLPPEYTNGAASYAVIF